MIKLIQSESGLDKAILMRTLSGRKMLAYMKAYGAGYDFCQFYEDYLHGRGIAGDR